MGSGKGWSSEETVAVYKAYVSASENPRSGNGKKKDLFASKVLECYQRYMEEVKRNNVQVSYSDRTGDAVVQRYRKARCEGLKFEEIVASIKAKKPTGDLFEKDIARAALAVYNCDARIGDMYTYLGDRTIDPGPEFSFQDPLWYLRNTNTWSLIMLSKQSKSTTREIADQAGGIGDENAGVRDGSEEDSPAKRSSSNSAQPVPTSLILSEVESKKERPVGAKRALGISKQVTALHKGAEGIEKLAAASQKRAKVAEDMLLIEKQQSMIALLSMPGTDPAVQQRFVQLSLLKALAALENEVYSTGDEPPSSIQILYPILNRMLNDRPTSTVSPPNNGSSGNLSSILNQ